MTGRSGASGAASAKITTAIMPRTFAEKVLTTVARIPRGEVRSYAEVAATAGSPRASRAVGNVMNANRDPGVPCHRVIRSDGRVGGYVGGAARKVERLREEGVVVREGRVIADGRAS